FARRGSLVSLLRECARLGHDSGRMHANQESARARSLAIFALAAIPFGAACGGTAPRPSCEPQENANLRIEATDRLNPDEHGRPLPTKVRIYQLANIGTMETATFEEIWQNDEETLGDAFLGKDELWIYPDSRISRQFERNPDANYIVGVAIVRRPTGVSWRSILELPPPAADAQCAALQQNPDAPPEQPPTVYLAFELDDYQIEGAVRLEYPPPPCPENDPICAAERAAREAAEGAAPEAPEAPDAPSAPTPDVPSAPSPPRPPAP
ncbi:MAG TPA: type VI secretion system lipoprotein TssJ, partial [Sandaracinaceae bacterium]